MDFDVIIYVIIGVVWVIVSIVQANQKAKKKRELQKSSAVKSAQTIPQKTPATKSADTQTKASNERIENWISELMGIENTATHKVETQMQEKEVYSERKESINEPIDVIEEVEGTRTTSLKETVIGSSNFVSQQYENDFLSDFDLRKAVIYSEILKNPYS